MRKKVCIGDLGTIVTGNTPPRNRPELYGNHTPFIKATDISESVMTYSVPSALTGMFSFKIKVLLS